MTSTNDGKDVKSNQTSSHKGKSYYIDLYKSLEKHLSEECELRTRTQHLCSAWRRVHSLCQHSAHTTHPHYLAWLQRHTANTLLQTEWQSEKDEHAKLQEAIDSFIEESKAAATNRNGHSPAWESQLVQRGEWFKKILGNPWGHPVLKVLCDPRSKPPSDEDILEWLKEERGVMFVTRLRHLAASKKCHEIALSLVTAVMDRKRACETLVPDAEQADEQEPPQPEGSKATFKDILGSEAGFTLDVWELLTDLELVLLHKRNEHPQCIALAKKIPLRSGYQLVERLRSRPETSPREKKLWKNAGDVATLVAQVLITRCMVVPSCRGAVRSALYCCARSLVRLLPAATLAAAASALAAPAATARHLHTLAAAVHTQLQQKAEDMNSFVCELYVRAITAGMNELEKLKLKTEKEAEARSTEQTLASWFTSLGSLLACSVRIQCECVLTAFSVHPTAAMYDKICAQPRLTTKQVIQEPKEETKSEFGSWASDSRSQTNLVKTSETLNLKQTQQHTNVMSTAIFAEGEALGLSAELCQDLTVCLSGPRVKTLSWDMDREVLLENCRTYMERTHGGTRALTTELKYLNLDPSEYQHLPEEEDNENDVYYGIEKGYEHLVELQEEVGWEEELFDHEATETAYSSEDMEEIRLRRKKKSKKLVLPSDDESDPLSTFTESNKGDKKKERPHSKERSKEKKKKSKNPEDKAKRKEKKERKKKEKIAKAGSLASLIGVKVTTELGLTISDSDYDSQGKSSLASEGNDPNVVFDGLFNMDDPLSEQKEPKLMNGELSVVNGEVVVNKEPKKRPSNKNKSKSSTNLSTIETKPVHSVKSLLNLNSKPPRPSASGVVSEQVKRSITKLLQFRRNQNSVLAQKSAAKPEHKPLNAIYKPEFPSQQVISPKSVIVPEIPKSYINKMDRLNAERNSSTFLNPTSIGHPLYRSNSDTRHNVPPQHSHKSNSEPITPQTFSSPELPRPVSKYKEIVNYKFRDILTIPNFYQNTNFNQTSTPNILGKSPSPRVQPKHVSTSLSRVDRTPQAQEHAKSYENFLIDLKTAANPAPTACPEALVNKDVRSMSRVSPSMSGYPDLTISQQCAKQAPQKKVENAPNTFSRLSYMKNKQSDFKHKQTVETHASRKEELSQRARAQTDLSRCMSEFKNTKLKYMQATKADTVITRVDNPLNLSCNNPNIRKAGNEQSTSSHSIMNILQPSTSISQTPVSRYDVDTNKAIPPATKTSYLTEKDQNDLLLMLRQQNRINAARNAVSHVPPTPHTPINMTTDNASSSLSNPVQTTSLMNNNFIQYANTTESKETSQPASKLSNSLLIRPPKNVPNPGGRGSKKATKANVRNHTSKGKPKESDVLDWEKVMNAIRAQKTPSRGPSALELALKTSADPSDNSLRNQRIVRTSSVEETNKITKTVETIISQANNINTQKTSVISFSQPPKKDVVSTTQDIQNKSVIVQTPQSDLQNISIECKKSTKNAPNKTPTAEVDKKQLVSEKNKFATTISKNKDPFISGREEDYNLSDLDDLLDDELRRELGELSSDEESYRMPQLPKEGSKRVKLLCSKNSNSSNKQSLAGGSGSQKEKIQVPNPPHTMNKQYQQDEISVSNCKYTKPKECVRSQTNETKTKAPESIDNSLQYQNIIKANNENLNKKVLPNKHQGGDLSSHYENMTPLSKPVIKNPRKISAPNLHHQYSTVNKDLLNETVNTNNRATDPCLGQQYLDAANRSTCVVEEPRKVYVVPTVVPTVSAPTPNIVLLGTDMFYSPIPIIQSNINSVFLQQNETHNITVPQPVYCATPVCTPHISTSAVSTPTMVNFDQTSQMHHVTNQLDLPASSQSQFNDNSEHIEVKTGYVNATINTDQPLQENTANLDNNVMTDINSNKQHEGSVLSEVQECRNLNVCDTAPASARSRSISTEEVLSDILNNQDQTVANDLLVKNSAGKKVMNDVNERYSINDIERLMRKRLAIINRQIVHNCIYPPIALSYAPIFKKLSHIDICHKKLETSVNTRKHNVAPQDIGDFVSEDNPRSIDVNQKKSDTRKVVEEIVDETIKTSPSINVKETSNEHSKENTSISTTCRRIMLRSSNKNLPNISTDVNDKNPIGRKTKVRLKVAKKKINYDTNELNINNDEIVISKTNHKKKVKRKTVVTKNKTKLIHESKDCGTNDNTEICVSETLPVLSLDIEDVLLDSKIPNINLVQTQAVTALEDADSEKSSTNKAKSDVTLQNKNVKLIPPQSTSDVVVDEKSNANEVVISQNKKVSLRRKRKSSKIVVKSSIEIDESSKKALDNVTDIDTGVANNHGDNHRVTRSVTKTPIEKIIQNTRMANPEDTNCLNKTIFAKKLQATVPKMPVLINDVTEQESNGNTNKTQTSNLDRSTIVTNSQSNDTTKSSTNIINDLNKTTTNKNHELSQHIDEGIKSTSKTFQSILEKNVVNDNQGIINQISGVCQQKSDVKIKSTEAFQKIVDSEADADKSVCSSNVESSEILHEKRHFPLNADNTKSSNIMPPNIVENSKLLQGNPQLATNGPMSSNVAAPNVVSNKILHEKSEQPKESNTSKICPNNSEKCNIPQSYKDSIIIEEISNNKGSDVTKLLRVKLPNGKVFKASVYGKMHSSFDSLFEDPSLRAMLMSDFNEHRKYTLNIKQISKTNRENPEKPIETRIQEIQVKTKNLAPAVIETIDLLSDDDEKDDSFCFKTKTGVYKTLIKDKDIVAKHQAKLDQNCCVKVEKLVLPNINNNSEVSLSPQIDGNSDILDDVSLPPVFLNSKHETIRTDAFNVQNIPPMVDICQNDSNHVKQYQNSNVIDIDESSNDSIDLLKNCPEGLIADVSLTLNNYELLEDVYNDIVKHSNIVNNSKTSMDVSTDPADNTNNVNEVQLLEDNTNISNENLENVNDYVRKTPDDNFAGIVEYLSTISNNEPCVDGNTDTVCNPSIKNEAPTLKNIINIANNLETEKKISDDNIADVAQVTSNGEEKIPREDNFNKAVNTINNLLIVNDKENYEIQAPEAFIPSKDDTPTCDTSTIKTQNCFVPLIRCDDLVKFYNIQYALNKQCFVSLQRCDSIIESLKGFENDVDAVEINNIPNEILDATIESSDTETSSTASISILKDLSFFSEKYDEGNGRNSPVIEVFEAIACLRKKCEIDKEGKTGYHTNKFECEWLLTKRQIHIGCKNIEIQENTSVLKRSFTPRLDDLSTERPNLVDIILVPSLVSIMTLFFQDSSVLDQYRPVSKKQNVNRLNISPTICLKRKMPKLADNIVANKLSKLVLGDKDNSVNNVISKRFNGEYCTMIVSPDGCNNESKPFIVENEMHHINNIPQLVSNGNQGNKTEIIDDFTNKDIYVCKEHNQNVVIVTNIDNSYVNTCSELSPKEIKNSKTACNDKMQNKIMKNYVNGNNSITKNASASYECKTESRLEIMENITNESKTLEEIEDFAQNQDVLEVNIMPNRSFLMDNVIDSHNNDNSVSIYASLNCADKISTLAEKSEHAAIVGIVSSVPHTTDVESSQTDSYLGESESPQCHITDIIEIKNDEGLKVVEFKIPSQDQQSDGKDKIMSPCQENYEHLESDVLNLNVSEHSSEVLTIGNRQFNYTIEVESFQITDTNVEYDNIDRRISKNIVELNQDITSGEIAKSQNLVKNQSEINFEKDNSEVYLYDNIVNKPMPPNENIAINNIAQLDDVTVTEYFKDVVDLKKYKNIVKGDLIQDVEDKKQKQGVEQVNDEQLVENIVVENPEDYHSDSTTYSNKCIDKSIHDANICPEIADIENECCIGLEVTCGDVENIDNELLVGKLTSAEISIESCYEKNSKAERKDKIFVQNPIPDHEYTDLLRAPGETAEMQTYEKGDDDITPCVNNVFNDDEDRSKCMLRGVEIEDPDVGVVYVLYPIDDSTSDVGTPNSSYEDITETFEETEVAEDVVDRDDNKDMLEVNIPKMTYSKPLKYGLNSKQHLKRKIDFSDPKPTPKKYRKGKNIDYPKITTAAILEQGYTKEYKRVLDYSSSLKFSYTQPFHKDYLDIDKTIKDWPIKGPCVSQPELAIESQCTLFTDMETNVIYEPEILNQTLQEEINQNYTEKTEPSSDINEINFNMGFGEGSGRVIQNLEDVDDNSKVSAATLSDVKQPQPFILSEDCEQNRNNMNAAKDDQIEKIQRYLTYIQLRDKVKTFFQKSSIELEYDVLGKKKDVEHTYDSTNFPFDLYIQNFMEPRPFEAIVQVVQVGQLPVSAAAQNPVTCDPRVTHVSDASPSQCSVESSPHDESSTPIKTEYTELTTADLSLPLMQDYVQHTQTMDLHDNQNVTTSDENIPIETEIKSVVKIELMEELPEEKEKSEFLENSDIQSMEVNHSNNEYYYEENNTPTAYETTNVTSEYDPPNTIAPPEETNAQMMYNTEEKQTVEGDLPQEKQQNGSPEKTDQIAHAMSAAGITTTAETAADNGTQALVDMLSQKMCEGAVGANTTAANSYPKTTAINAMALQQALAQILPPPLNQTNVNDSNQQAANNQATPQVLHIVQGKNASGSQITLVDNSQQSVISGTNTTPVLHIVQNKGGTTGATTNGASGAQTNSFSGLSLVDAGLQQGGNQLLHIVNTGSQKNNNTGQLLKRVNLLTNLANVQGSNEQKMVQFVCKSADGKSIQLNAPHQRSMVLRLQPIESPAPASQSKTAENQESLSPSPAIAQNKDSASQQEIKSRSVYEENYAKFIQNSSTKPAAAGEKSTSLPKFNQAFGKPVFEDGTQKSDEINTNMPAVNAPQENSESQPADSNAINLEHISQINSPPLLLRKSPAQTSQAQTNLVQQIKQTIAPMNIQTMHGGVIYTRQIPVNIGGGQTINLITVPSTELIDESGQKQQPNQGEIEPSIIKIVPQTQPNSNTEVSSEENGNNAGTSNENNQNPQPQPVLTQMRIKLPMLSKTPQMVSGSRVVRPSFFQIQRNVIGGANQPVYQQLVLTAAPPLGQQTIRLPTAQANRQQLKVPTESQSTESMSSSTLEQLREFDMVLEQVKERSTVQPNSNSSTTFPKLHTPSTDTTDNATSVGTTPSEPSQSQVLYSIGNNQPLNVAYVNRKTPVSTPTTSTFVRSPDSSGIADSPTSSTHVQIPHTVTSESTSSETPTQPKPAKVGSKSKSRPKSSSHPPNNMKINPVPPKTSTQKPLEDEQTTQRILYILAEYKEQVENSPDKDKPAPRRRSHPPSNPGSSKRKKSSSGSRRHGRDMSPIHGEDTCRTMGSEDSSCGTSQGDCNESCLESHSPQDSPRKIVRKLTFEHETPVQQPRPQPQRNVIVADGQTITVARGTAGKPTTAVLMPANYILPVSMVKSGQQIAIVTNRGPKLLTVGGGERGTTNALLLQRLIGPAGLKPVLARPGVRHVRLPAAALHNLQAFNLAAAATVQPPDSTASPAPAPTPPELIDTRAASSPWTDRESQDVKADRGSSPEEEPWNLPSSADPHDYTYEETVRAENMDRTVLVVHKKDGTSQRHHRLTHVSAAALRHKYAILEHELRLQKSLSEECEDLGVDSPSASELFPEAELLFAASPAHDHAQEQGAQSHTTQPSHASIPQPDIDDQIATDQLLNRDDIERQQLELGLEDVGIVSVGDGMQHIALNHEEFARAHPNTTFHSEPTEEAPVQPFTIAGLKGRHITSTIFHSNRAPATVLMTAPQTTVISQATADPHAVKYDLDHMINSLPSSHNINLSSVLVKDDGLTRFDSILNDSRELHLTHTASAIVHSTGNATQVIRRVCYDDKRDRDTSFLMDEPDALIAGDDAKMVAEDSSRDATLESMADVDDDRSSPERHTELFWESNSASERSESRRPLDFSSDSDKCCKSPSYDETNSTDSSGVGTHMRLDSVIKDARGIERSGSADGSSADDTHPPLRTYPPKRTYHPLEGEMERSLSGKTRAGERSPDSVEVRRRASGRGVVKRGCHCCNGSPSPAPPRPKKSRQRKPTMDFTN
ncbi:uncharacterized protein LOC128680224 isoform X2 [Plodia interpunctella]|uniref:uncharacterized protein LOC128680224 isoform X2 n=1 Tax=Plodia interpunctella TaxID=58824 RepID=UPI0023687395|nr:uncharacterized protein LOC128680224 isoform X2 [Plodia interpunctella]